MLRQPPPTSVALPAPPRVRRHETILPTELDRSLVRDTGRDLVLDGAASSAFAGGDTAVDSSEPAAVGSVASACSKEQPHPPLDPGDGGRDSQGKSLWVPGTPLDRQHAMDGVSDDKRRRTQHAPHTSLATPPVYPWRGLAAFVASVPRPVWGDPGVASELLALGITVRLGKLLLTRLLDRVLTCTRSYRLRAYHPRPYLLHPTSHSRVDISVP
jgi:hypothetical protein